MYLYEEVNNQSNSDHIKIHHIRRKKSKRNMTNTFQRHPKASILRVHARETGIFEKKKKKKLSTS